VEEGVAEVGIAKEGAAEDSPAESGPVEGGPAEGGPAEVRSDALVLIPPLIPRLDALLQDLEMLRVRHRLRLPLCSSSF